MALLKLALFVTLVTLVKGQQLLRSQPFDPFRIECPQVSGVSEINLRMVHSTGGKRSDILFETGCTNIDELTPLTKSFINEVLRDLPEAPQEQEKCRWSTSSFDPELDTDFNDTCEGREYMAGVSRVVDNRIQFLCCRLRTRQLQSCHPSTFPLPTDNQPVVHLRVSDSIIASLHLSKGLFTATFCKIKLRDLAEIIEEEKDGSSEQTTTERIITTEKVEDNEVAAVIDEPNEDEKEEEVEEIAETTEATEEATEEATPAETTETATTEKATEKATTQKATEKPDTEKTTKPPVVIENEKEAAEEPEVTEALPVLGSETEEEKPDVVEPTSEEKKKIGLFPFAPECPDPSDSEGLDDHFAFCRCLLKVMVKKSCTEHGIEDSTLLMCLRLLAAFEHHQLIR